jgi:hypothetical protein
VRWRTDETSVGSTGQSSCTSSYGYIQKAPAGTNADLGWWHEVRYHHYDFWSSHEHRYVSPCNSPDCGYNWYTVWQPA